ncbi:hypothetical protein D9M73_269990 [compost metagenome]
MKALVVVGTFTGLLGGLASCRVVVAVSPDIWWVWLGMLPMVAVTFSVPEISPMVRVLRLVPVPWAIGNRPCRLGSMKVVWPLPP